MRFRINAIDARQQVVALELDAISETLALQAARERGLTVLSLRAHGFALRMATRPSKKFPTTLFSVELLSLLDAGLNLVEALQTLGEKETHGERQIVLSGILD